MGLPQSRSLHREPEKSPRSGSPQSSVQKLTCPYSVFQCVPTIHQNLLQGLRVVRKLQVEALHALQELVWVMEVQNFGGSVKSLPHVVEEDVHNLQQELHGLLLTILGGQQICGANQLSALALGERSRDEPASEARSAPRTWEPRPQRCLVAAGQPPGPSRPVGKGEPRSPTTTAEVPPRRPGPRARPATLRLCGARHSRLEGQKGPKSAPALTLQCPHLRPVKGLLSLSHSPCNGPVPAVTLPFY